MRKSDRIFKPISLLPPDYKKQIFLLRVMKHVVLGTGVFLLLTSILYMITPFLFWSKNQAVAVVDNDILNIKSSISAMQKYEDIYNKEKKYDSILNRAMGKIPDWDSVLTDVMTTKPIKVMINEVKVSQETPAQETTSQATKKEESSITEIISPGYKLVVKGVTEDLSDVTFWSNKLKSLDRYKGASIGTVTMAENGYEFQLILDIQPGDAYKITKEVVQND